MTPLLLAVALGQDYAFPTSPDDRQHYYPTAYKDQGGTTDWNCGGITYSGHGGSDFGAGSFPGMDDGRDVTAAAAGTVVVSHDGEFDRCTTGNCAAPTGYGNYVQIAHADGKSTIYGHLKQYSVLVDVGDTVSCGDKIGEMGSSGNSTGPHLHFEVREASNVSSDPFDGPCSAPPSYWTDQGVYDGLPGDLCDDPVPCTPEQELTCGDVVTGRSDEGGSTTETWRYGCTDYVYSGPERSFLVTTDRGEPVTVRISGLTGDLDLFALSSDACDGTDCITSSISPDTSDEEVVFDAVAGVATVVVFDGWEGAVSDVTLTVSCDGSWPPEATGHTGTAGEPTADTGTDVTDPTEPGGTPPGDDDDVELDEVDEIGGAQPVPRASGCGCAQAPSPGSWTWLTRRR